MRLTDKAGADDSDSICPLTGTAICNSLINPF